jgi:hypothetical protein
MWARSSFVATAPAAQRMMPTIKVRYAYHLIRVQKKVG